MALLYKEYRSPPAKESCGIVLQILLKCIHGSNGAGWALIANVALIWMAVSYQSIFKNASFAFFFFKGGYADGS